MTHDKVTENTHASALLDVPSTWTSGVFERPGARLHYHRAGHGDKRTVVLLHGGGDSGLCWLRVAKALEADFDLVLPDARGHGETEFDGETFTMSDTVDDTAALITHLGGWPVTLIGHSMGAQLATELGARYPELVDRIVLEDPAYAIASSRGPRRFFLFTVIRLMMLFMRRRSPDQIRRLADRFMKGWTEDDKAPWAVAQYQSSRKSPKALTKAFDRNRDWPSYLRKIQAPTLLVTAEKGLVKPAEADVIMAALAHGTRVHVARARHNVRRDNYPEFMEAVSAFIR